MNVRRRLSLGLLTAVLACGAMVAVPAAQAAEAQGITPTITVKNTEVDYWTGFSVDIDFDVPGTVRGGDTFTLELADTLRLLGSPVALRTPGGDLVATVTADGPTLTYTFTD